MKDILVDDTGDLAIRQDRQDFVLSDADEDITQRVLVAFKGEFKEFPLLGADIQKMINGTVDPFWNTETKEMLRSCGIPVSSIRFIDNEILIQ
ncbi:MAG: hypothetical protein RR386_08825 [Bacteroidaceae bacterium]